MLDAGDIIQTLAGWTVIGYGKSQLPLIRFLFEGTRNLRQKSTEIRRGLQAMDEAISELSLKCSLMDASRALYLLSAPVNGLTTAFKHLYTSLERRCIILPMAPISTKN